jgi:hypothetical protein
MVPQFIISLNLWNEKFPNYLHIKIICFFNPIGVLVDDINSFCPYGYIHNKKEPRTACTCIKSYTPTNLKNDYMGYKDYNLMKSCSKCLYIYEFSSQ